MKIVDLVCISVINVRNTIVYTLHTFDMLMFQSSKVF